MKKSMFVLAAIFLVLAVSSGAFAAKGLLTGAGIENGSLTGSDIKKGSLGADLLTGSARNSLRGATGSAGSQGVAGLAGGTGGVGANGSNGTDGLAGAKGSNGTNGAAGTNGTNGANGTVTPLSATAGLTALPTASGPVAVVYLDVPAGKYVILAKTELAQTGAGDSIDCTLKVGTSTLDQIAMKTLPALGAVPVSLQAVTTVASISRVSVDCAVEVANGTAAFSSLIAIPTS